ncbi:MAG: hypothetical protein D6780_02915 [Candidatus Dadabacteria bacterium]|nr:MAG: hypothetical protein D6780_02915 [Candidatus Dadabacteria bacterium]
MRTQARAVNREWDLRETNFSKQLRLFRARQRKTSKIHPLLAELLKKRGIKGRRLREFLKPSLSAEQKKLGTIEGIREAAEVFKKALRSRQKIAVISDFDVDGICSAVILKRTAEAFGCKCTVFSPERLKKGYGLSKSLIKKAAAEGAKTLFILDMGSNDYQEIAFAKSLGLEVVVIDHHKKTKEAEKVRGVAKAVVNPHFSKEHLPSQTLCSAALAWLMVQKATTLLRRDKRFNKAKQRGQRRAFQVSSLLPYTALATVADVMPLLGFNRAVVKRGLNMLKRSSHLGLRALLSTLNIRGDIKAADVSFKIAPVINAASRMMREKYKGKTAGELVVELFTTSKKGEAQRISNFLLGLNLQRKEEERKQLRRCISLVSKQRKLSPVIVVVDNSFSAGILGILAARLVDKYKRPSFVIKKGRNGLCVGSARGIDGIDLARAIRGLSHLLERGGGHKKAAGFTLKESKLRAFKKGIEKAVREQLRERSSRAIATFSDEIRIRVADILEDGKKIIEDIQKLEPLGYGNKEPEFYLEGLEVLGTKVINGRHLRVWLREDNLCIYGNLWFFDGELKAGDKVNLKAHLRLNKRHREYLPEQQAVELEIVECQKSA